MNITVLMENTAADPSVCCEHGLSLYIETGDHKILFDMGQSEAFAENAKKLGVDLKSVDLAVLSHGHYDHGGGLVRFLNSNPTAPVYLSQHAFGGHYNGTDKYIGLDQTLKSSDRLMFASADTELAPGLWLYMAESREGIYPLDPAGLKMAEEELAADAASKHAHDNSQQSGCLIPEDFRHEQYLMIRENGKRILFSGCSHSGILNIMEWFQPDILIGGFHFSKIDPQGEEVCRLDEAAKILGAYECTYYTCHCTGEKQYAYLKEQMGEKLQYVSAGMVLDL